MKPHLFSAIRNSFLISVALFSLLPAAYAAKGFDPEQSRACIDKVKRYLDDHSQQIISDDDFKECYLQYSKSDHFDGRSFSEFACLVGIYASVERLRDSFGLDDNPFGKDHVDTPVQQNKSAPIEISAFDFMNLYENNQLKADNLFKNKKVIILGEICDIRKDPDFGDVVVEIKADNFGIYSISAYMDKDFEQNALNFKIGEQIKVNGIVLGFAELGAGVDVDHATLSRL